MLDYCIHYNVEMPSYIIVDQILIDGTGDFHAVLIFNEQVEKYNFYIISIRHPYPEKKDAQSIVEAYPPLSMEMAKDFFPKYDLNEMNYGF